MGEVFLVRNPRARHDAVKVPPNETDVSPLLLDVMIYPGLAEAPHGSALAEEYGGVAGGS